jgi:protein phosphatase
VRPAPERDTRRTIDLPDPCLVVLVGAAGSGKTTLAARLFAPDQVLSSDAHRALISGDEADQQVTKAAFAVLHRRLARRMAEGLTTVVDATNVSSFARRSLVRRAVAHGIPAVAIVLDLPPELVVSRNATRAGRIVPEDAVRRQLGELAGSIHRGSLDLDGFEAVHVLHSAAEVDALTIGRRP